MGARGRDAAVPYGGRLFVYGAPDQHAGLHGPRTSRTLAERPSDGARHAATPDAAIAYSCTDAAFAAVCRPITAAVGTACATTRGLVSRHGPTQLEYRHLATEGARTQRRAWPAQ